MNWLPAEWIPEPPLSPPEYSIWDIQEDEEPGEIRLEDDDEREEEE